MGRERARRRNRQAGPLSFRVYPEHRSLFWSVLVYPSLRAMRRAHAIYRGNVNPGVKDGTSLRQLGRRTHAVVCPTTWTSYPSRRERARGARARTSPCLGAIFLSRTKLGGGLLSHEAAHAARYYFKRLGLSIDDDAMDERHAYALGWIVQKIAQRVW